MDMLYYFQNKTIPIDIISLCYKFYHINLTHLLSEDNSNEHTYQVTDIYRAVHQFWSSEDYYMCYEL